MRAIIFVVKRIVMAICILYAFDVIVSSAGVMIPINVVTISSVAFLGLPALFGLVVLEALM